MKLYFHANPISALLCAIRDMCSRGISEDLDYTTGRMIFQLGIDSVTRAIIYIPNCFRSKCLRCDTSFNPVYEVLGSAAASGLQPV